MAPRKYLSLRFIVKARHLTINLLLLPHFFLSIWCLYLSIFSRSCRDTVRYAEVSVLNTFFKRNQSIRYFLILGLPNRFTNYSMQYSRLNFLDAETWLIRITATYPIGYKDIPNNGRNSLTNKRCYIKRKIYLVGNFCT